MREGRRPSRLLHQDLRPGKGIRAMQLLPRSGLLHQVRMAQGALAQSQKEAEGELQLIQGGVYHENEKPDAHGGLNGIIYCRSRREKTDATEKISPPMTSSPIKSDA